MERSLADRVRGFWEERQAWEGDRWVHIALQALAEAVEDNQRRTRELEEVVYRGRPVRVRQEPQAPS